MIDESKEICIICFGVKEKASMEFMLTPHHREPQLVCMNCYNNNEHVNKIQKNLLKTAIYYNEMTWYNLLVEIQKKMNNRTREYSYTILRILYLALFF
jgi:hypothetical protein